jgi:sodium-dependent dicarboxylate transporter 2/3/5
MTEQPMPAAATEQFGGVEVLWSYWFIAFLPCSVITVLAAWWLTLWLYPPENATLEHVPQKWEPVLRKRTCSNKAIERDDDSKKSHPAFAGGADFLRTEIEKMGAWTTLEKKAALLLAVAILLWLTDFVHHISPAVIGMGVGLFALLPRVGILDIEDMKRLNYLPVFFVAAAVSMGTVLQVTKGLEVLTNFMFAWMQPHMTSVLATTVVMYWTAFLYHFLLASEISMLGTSIPLVMEFAKSHGMHPLWLGMIWTFAAGGKLFAYQSGVLIVGYSYGYFAARDLVRMGALLTIVEFVVLVLLVLFYWPLIGLT